MKDQKIEKLNIYKYNDKLNISYIILTCFGKGILDAYSYRHSFKIPLNKEKIDELEQQLLLYNIKFNSSLYDYCQSILKDKTIL